MYMYERNLGLYGGYPTFVISILMIGGVTAIIGDVAGHLGCFIYVKDTVNAIAFVALGTSVPGYYLLFFFLLFEQHLRCRLRFTFFRFEIVSFLDVAFLLLANGGKSKASW